MRRGFTIGSSLKLAPAVLALSILCVSLFVALLSGRPAPTIKRPHFTDVAARSNFSYISNNSPGGHKYFPQPMCGGVAIFDFDNDGLLDIFFTNGAQLPEMKKTNPSYYNCLLKQRADGTFEDVTAKAGLTGKDLDFNFGVAVGDYDNDGYPDLLVTGYGHTILYHNNGNGTFTDVTAKAGVADDGNWSTSAGWFDYDKDGYLDLFICNYLQWSPETNIWCGEREPGYRAYCNPDHYRGERLKLYHNNRDGTFTDVSDVSGVGKPEAKGMGVVLADFNNDGWPDIMVANDTWPNFLFLNNHDGTFREVAYGAGVAASEDGKCEAGMGVDAADLYGEGWLDIYITHLSQEFNRLYRNNHDESFDDATFSSGLGNKAYFLSGVGSRLFDYDNDGWVDIFQSNGSMLDNVELYQSQVSWEEPKLMFRNLGSGKFEKVSEQLGADFIKPTPGRGAAVADFDNDGDLDIVISNSNDFPQLLRNDGGNANHWLEVMLVGVKSNRDGRGASLKLTTEGLVELRQAQGGMGYMSAQDPRIHFGLGQRKRVESLEITWPSGIVDKLENVPINQIITVKEGVGIIPRNFPTIHWK